MSKHLLYLTNNHLTAYLWQRGSLSDGKSFDNDEAGRQAFSEYLRGEQNTAAYYLVADLIEENFQRDTLPHVLGKARRALVQRRLAQLYPDTPYRCATVQGREKDGRKDDLVLFNALTNATLPKPWLDIISSRQAPLAGMFSMALLCSMLGKRLGFAGAERLLLITHQSSGLRQSYFREGHLSFSRLAPLPGASPEATAEAIVLEIEKIRQFLASTRQLPRGDFLQIVILTNDANVRHLTLLCQDAPALIYRFISLDDAPRLLGLKKLDGISLCDPLFLSLLAAKAPASHFPVFDQTRFYRLWQARTAFRGLSIAALTCGVLGAEANFLAAMGLDEQVQQLDVEIRIMETRHRAVMSSLPLTAGKPDDMKSAVELERIITRNAPSPAALSGMVSRALDTLPEIKINRMQWQVGPAQESAAPPANAQQQPATDSSHPVGGATEPAAPATLVGVPKEPDQIVLIEGEIAPFQGDFRPTLQSVGEFAAELGKNKQLQVEVTRMPLDVSPAVKLEGKAGSDDGDTKTGQKANFTLKLLWKP